MVSFWEKNSFLTADYLIVGAGVTGLSIAATLLENEPQARVVVIEEHPFPRGASVRNAGFACFGSLNELVSDIAATGEDAARQRVADRWAGLQKLRQRLGDADIGYRPTGGYELLFENEEPVFEQMERVNELLRPVFQTTTFRPADDKIQTFCFNSKTVKRLVFTPFEGQIDSGKAVSAYLRYVQEKGGVLIGGASVTAWQPSGGGLSVETANGLRLQTQQLIFATNAFTRRLFPHLPILPGRGQVVLTAPIPNLAFDANFHFHAGYYYFRSVGRRVLLGGGRNLDFEGETTDEWGVNPLIYNDLVLKLQTLILPDQPFEIEQNWCGIMAFTPNKMPIVQQQEPGVWIAAGMNGMGVALAAQAGELLYEKMKG